MELRWLSQEKNKVGDYLGAPSFVPKIVLFVQMKKDGLIKFISVMNIIKTSFKIILFRQMS